MDRVYLFIHLVSVCLLFVSLGGMVQQVGAEAPSKARRQFIMMTHGTAMLLILLAGVATLHRIDGSFSERWVHAKLGIWMVLGAAPAFIYRKPALARMFWFVLPVFGGLAFYFARWKLL